MRQYDKIYIPVNQMANEGVYLIATERTTMHPLLHMCLPLKHKEWLEEHKDVIVMTEKELHNMLTFFETSEMSATAYINTKLSYGKI